MDSLSVPTVLQNAAILTVILALDGYLITSLSAHTLARRGDKLDLVNQRLNEFYGPLLRGFGSWQHRVLLALKRQGKEKSGPFWIPR